MALLGRERKPVDARLRLNDRWRYDPFGPAIAFEPVQRWRRYWPWPRTPLIKLWRDLNSWADDEAGQVYAMPLDRDSAAGIRNAPRRMWCANGATIDPGGLPIWMRLKAAKRGDEPMVLTSDDTRNAKVLVRPWMTRELGGACFTVLYMAGSLASILALARG